MKIDNIKPILTVENFLELKNPKEYDFKNEIYQYYDFNEAKFNCTKIQDSQELIEKIFCETGLHKYFLMKKYIFQNQYIGSFDCDNSDDSCNLTGEIYSKLWGWSKNTYNSFGEIEPNCESNKGFKCGFGGDTMNSVQTLLNRITSPIISETSELRNFSKERISIDYMLGLYENLDLKDIFLNKLNSNELLIRYINRYNTIGNFTLVPERFNGGRGGEDYWDFALNKLKSSGWHENFNHCGNNIKDYNKYINYFFLWDYISISNVITMEYQSKSLFDKEFNKIYDENTFTKDENLIRIFLGNATYCIERRSVFMIAMLCLQKIIGGDSYFNLREKVFSNDNMFYHNYSEVIASIKNYLSGINQNHTTLLDKALVDINNIKNLNITI